MARPRMGDVRRKELIRATVETISMHGLADTTVQKISERAGLSAGIVHHYFSSKDALLEATMRELLGELRQSVVEKLRLSKTPYERIVAVVDANFAEAQFSQDTVRTWLALWNCTPYSKEIARLQKVNQLRTHSNLRHSLKHYLSDEAAHMTASNLVALINGLWLRCALDPAGCPTIDARFLALSLINDLLDFSGMRRIAGDANMLPSLTGHSPATDTKSCSVVRPSTR